MHCSKMRTARTLTVLPCSLLPRGGGGVVTRSDQGGEGVVTRGWSPDRAGDWGWPGVVVTSPTVTTHNPPPPPPVDRQVLVKT